jgi:hypothetical protein
MAQPVRRIPLRLLMPDPGQESPQGVGPRHARLRLRVTPVPAVPPVQALPAWLRDGISEGGSEEQAPGVSGGVSV